MRHAVAVLLVLASPPFPSPARAADPPAPDPSGGAPATGEEVKALAEEVRRLKLEIAIPEAEYRSYAGLGPADSKVYFVPKGLSIGGYGEAVYSKYLGAPKPALSDLQRVVVYAGYRFSPTIVFNAEVEFEHGSTEGAGAVSVEFAYLDFLLSQPVRLRVGNVLVPVGFINEVHEPVFFHGVFRPEVERRIIPSTWNENGLGLFGEVVGLRYKAYLLNGLDATRGEGFGAGSWIREGRTGGSKSVAESLAGVLSLAWDAGPLALGASVYRGRSGQGKSAPDGSPIRGDILLGEVHAGLSWRGLLLRTLFAAGALGDADRISAALGRAGREVVGSRVWGAYAEVAYDLLPALAPEVAQGLSPFLRYEAMNLHDRVPAGGEPDPAQDQRILTAGLTYKPIPNVVAKADYQRKTTAAGTGAVEQVNLGVGFVF